jgi:hypothetical protein
MTVDPARCRAAVLARAAAGAVAGCTSHGSRYMRVVTFGASGNVGIALIRALTAGTAGHEIIGVARRKPSTAPGGAEWVAADIAEAQLDTSCVARTPLCTWHG